MSDTATTTPEKGTLLTHLQTLAVELGKPPTVVDMHRDGDYHPRIYVDAFGGWDAALEAADLDPDDAHKKITDLELLSDLQRLADKFGRAPKKTELADHGEYSAKTYQKRFGSWNDALREAMLDTRTLSDRDLLQELKRLDDELDHTPRARDMAEHGQYGEVTYYRRFGSWVDALAEAGLDPSPEQQHKADSRPDESTAWSDEPSPADDAPESSFAIESPPNEAVVTPEGFARTYDDQTFDDPWTAVTQYWEVKDCTATHPDNGSTAVANALDLPRDRIQRWIEDDGRPDPVRGIQTAEDRGWLPLTIDDDQFQAVNTLVAWVCSSGSIDERFAPTFVVDDAVGRQRIMDALDELGVDGRVIREDDSGRATEITPDSDASALGRILAVLGAPQVGKDSEAEPSLPEYLRFAPAGVRSRFVDVYLFNRAQISADTQTLSLHENRREEYLAELATLIQQVSGGDVSVSGRSVVASAEAVRNLYGKFGPQWS